MNTYTTVLSNAREDNGVKLCKKGNINCSELITHVKTAVRHECTVLVSLSEPCFHTFMRALSRIF